MGKFSTPRGNNSRQPHPEIESEEELDLEYDLDLEEDSDYDSDLSDYPTYSHSDNGYYTQPAPRKNRSTLIICLCAIAILLLAGTIAGVMFFSNGGADDGLILPNVSIAGVNVGGMSPEQATAVISQATALTYSDVAMQVQLPDTILSLSPADTGATLDVAAVVEAAYNYGRNGTKEENKAIRDKAETSTYVIPLLNYLTLDTNFVRETLENYCSDFNSDFTPSSATITGDLPVLDPSDEDFDPEAPCQVLVLETGTPGRYIDANKLYNQVLEAYNQNLFTVTVSLEEAESIPDPLSMQVLELYEQSRLEPADAIMDKETFEVTYESYGYTFDLDAALAWLEQSTYGDTFELAFEYIAPEHTKADLESVLFRDELAYYETKHTNNANRNTNLKLACEAINGMILNPGEKFDYNTALGKRTAEAGYKAADAYDAGQTVQVLGGGICQVSSTLYYCTLIADLEILSRTAHSYVSSYMPLGMDATVSWGGPEFRFRNNTNYPIRIEAEVSGGYVKIRLVGTDEKSYYVKMEYEVLGYTNATTVYEEYAPNNEKGYRDGQVITTAYNGCTVQTYKLKYDKQTNELISREEDQLSKYKKRDKVVVKIVNSSDPTQAPTEAPAETPTEAPEVTPTEAPVTPTEPSVTATEPA